MTEAQLNQQLAHFFGKITNHFDSQFAAFEKRTDERFDKAQNTLDWLVNETATHTHKLTAINSQLNRHDTWVKQLARKTKTKLQPDT